MWRIQVAVATLLATIGRIESYVSPAGKCDIKNIVPDHISIEKIEEHSNWRILYATEFSLNEDHETYLLKVIGTRKYDMVNKKVLKDKTELVYKFGMIFIAHIFIEDAVDEQGVRYRFFSYPLGLTSSVAMLIYRCSDVGTPGQYDRFIVVPQENTPSESEIQQLLAADKAVFGDDLGTLRKLPEKYAKF